MQSNAKARYFNSLSLQIQLSLQISSDSSAYSFSGLAVISPLQLMNLDVLNCLYLIRENVWKDASGLEDEASFRILEDALKVLPTKLIYPRLMNRE